MPPFRLDVYEKQFYRKPQQRIIHTKNFYSEGVKYSGWEEIRENQPYDVDPLCPGKVNHFLSHYKRFGSEEEGIFKTTTNEMLQQVFNKDTMIPEQLMGNYYTYNDNYECLTEYKDKKCPRSCANDFVTTIQHSYQLPYPYKMQRLAFPKGPWMAYRKVKNEVPLHSVHKFYDDAFDATTMIMRKHKSFQWISYNPATGKYTNPTAE